MIEVSELELLPLLILFHVVSSLLLLSVLLGTPAEPEFSHALAMSGLTLKDAHIRGLDEASKTTSQSIVIL